MLSQAQVREIELQDLTIRPATAEDVEAIVEVINAHSMKLEGTNIFTVEEYRNNTNRSSFNRTTDSRVVTTPEGRIVGGCDLWFNTPFVRTFVSARVHPEYWGQGIGTALLRWGEARARERIADAPDGARVTIGAGTISNNDAAHELFKAEDWQLIRHFYDMNIDLDSPVPAPQWPDGIIVRTLKPDQDEEAVYRAIDEAFRDHWGHVERPFEEGFEIFLHYFKNNPYYDPDLCFLAMADDEIAGVALCLPKTTEFPDMGWVEDLGVRRPWRKQGIALALLHHAFGEFYRRGIRKAGLGVDGSSLTGAVRLYERAGMHKALQFDGYEKELRAGKDLATQAAAD